MNYKKIVIVTWVSIILGIVVAFTQYGRIKRFYFGWPDLPKVSNIKTSKTIEIDYSDRVWIHRVNTISKLMDVKDRYKGLEIDIYYDTISTKMEVCHWPDVEPQGLYLENMFDTLQNASNYYFWLDFKNLSMLDNQRCYEALSVIDAITDRYSMDRKNIIIESSSGENLTLFTQNGYLTSYAIPYLTLSPSRFRITKWYNEISANLKNNDITFLSGYYEMLPYVNHYFPEHYFLVFTLPPNLSKVILIDED
jgi:hypothetical protein